MCVHFLTFCIDVKTFDKIFNLKYFIITDFNNHQKIREKLTNKNPQWISQIICKTQKNGTQLIVKHTT